MAHAVYCIRQMRLCDQVRTHCCGLQVLEFVLKAVKAEAFNEKKTLFLFGSYTIGKEKLFLEVARSLKQKVCTAADEAA